jgi:hypothetical protein
LMFSLLCQLYMGPYLIFGFIYLCINTVSNRPTNRAAGRLAC